MLSNEYCDADQFFFSICPVAAIKTRGDCACPKLLKSGATQFLDTSLLLVCRQVRTEALAVLFSHDTFDLGMDITLSKAVDQLTNAMAQSRA